MELINDILDLSKIEAGQVELDYGSISVNYLCKSSLAFIRQQAWQKSIRLETKLPPHLPELWVDERRIRQVLINLLNNAVKFTPEGGCITLAVSPLLGEPALDGRDSLRISVIDTGIGIAPEDIPKLFQPFVQIDGALNRQYNGTGLGLALVKRIVELHGRQIGLTSELGQGSCFTIDLPCASRLPLSPTPETRDRPVALPELNASPDNPAPIASPLILLAEDNAANIITVTSYLSAKGYRILLAKNGQEAVEFAQTHQPDIILMDIQMPEIDGLEAIKQIRLLPALKAIPIIALTALAMTSDRDNCLAAGANDYVAKPVKLKQLTAAILQFLAPQNSP